MAREPRNDRGRHDGGETPRQAIDKVIESARREGSAYRVPVEDRREFFTKLGLLESWYQERLKAVRAGLKQLVSEGYITDQQAGDWAREHRDPLKRGLLNGFDVSQQTLVEDSLANYHELFVRVGIWQDALSVFDDRLRGMHLHDILVRK